MSEATVKPHVSHLLDKLDVRNRVKIAILVHDAGEAPNDAGSLGTNQVRADLPQL